MDPSRVRETLLNHPALHPWHQAIQKQHSCLVEGIESSLKALLLWRAREMTGKRLLILTEESAQNHLIDDLSYFFQTDPIFFPAADSFPEENRGASPDIVGSRFKALQAMHQGQNRIVVTSIKAAFEKVVMPEALSGLFFPIALGSSISFSAFQEQLAAMGYQKSSCAIEQGSFAVRGGIIDLFGACEKEPWRIEFLGDEIVSIRTYDPVSQLSRAKIKEAVITPTDERRYLEMKSHEGVLLDYLGDELILVFDDLYALEDYFTTFGLAKNHPFLLSKEDFFSLTEPLQKIYFTKESIETLSTIKMIGDDLLEFEAFGYPLQATRIRSSFYSLATRFCPPDIPSESFTGELLLQEITNYPIEIAFLIRIPSDGEFIDQALKEKTSVAHFYKERGYLSSGFFLKSPDFALVPASEFTKRTVIRHKTHVTELHTFATANAAPLNEHFDLVVGEPVVHLTSGIGRYLGIEKRKNHLGVEAEFMLIEYAEKSTLYVPIEQAYLVSKYIGATAERPDYHTLGTSRWQKTLERSEQAIVEYAQDLLELEAKRAHKEGFAYPQDGPLIAQFASEFPYQITPDQASAVEQISFDMQKAKPMDRIVCGDVGYGKTEVAMRAAFKAVVDGKKQVAVLVPTTVLAMQHYETFSERMRGFAVNIKVLSRFVTAKESAATLQGLVSGTVDIVIGTHRMISKDVAFQNLGLVIIDEEQRFGVKAKEHLKKLKNEVDCLTLSATPIPRTLYLSLVGARDMSLINTPPLDRLPIQTVITERQNEVLRTAILRELSRDGQIFVIHNRIETLYELASTIRTLVPEAKIAVAHGQMDADELDLLFHAFKSGEADILVSTAIVENGIDIPNANTILVDRADHFGLADLYQLRGRVGRWNRRAYCYFLVHDLKGLSEISKRRLSAIASAPGMGGGMKVALFDLEIRGAGNILGTTQSGHISSIGFSLYCKLLKRAVARLKEHKKPTIFADVKLDFPFDARIPEEYIAELSLRLEMYGRIGDLESKEQIKIMQEELNDRFGPLPLPVQWLLSIAEIRLFAIAHHFSLIRLTKVALEAEQSHGPKKKIVKKILMAPIKTPELLVERVVFALQENFPSSV